MVVPFSHHFPYETKTQYNRHDVGTCWRHRSSDASRSLTYHTSWEKQKLPSLKLAAKSPKNSPGPQKERLVSQPPFLRGYVGLVECAP